MYQNYLVIIKFSEYLFRTYMPIVMLRRRGILHDWLITWPFLPQGCCLLPTLIYHIKVPWQVSCQSHRYLLERFQIGGSIGFSTRTTFTLSDGFPDAALSSSAMALSSICNAWSDFEVISCRSRCRSRCDCTMAEKAADDAARCMSLRGLPLICKLQIRNM